jgi:hypothetical protein
MKRLFKTIKRLFNRWKYTGSFRRPGCRLTLQELEELAKLLTKNKP